MVCKVKVLMSIVNLSIDHEANYQKFKINQRSQTHQLRSIDVKRQKGYVGFIENNSHELT